MQPWITSLDLGGLISISDAAMFEVAATCTPLKSLDLRGCSSLTMDCVRALRLKLVNLQHFVGPPCASKLPHTCQQQPALDV
jgi:hypothetical protein